MTNESFSYVDKLKYSGFKGGEHVEGFIYLGHQIENVNGEECARVWLLGSLKTNRIVEFLALFTNNLLSRNAIPREVQIKRNGKREETSFLVTQKLICIPKDEVRQVFA